MMSVQKFPYFSAIVAMLTAAWSITFPAAALAHELLLFEVISAELILTRRSIRFSFVMWKIMFILVWIDWLKYFFLKEFQQIFKLSSFNW